MNDAINAYEAIETAANIDTAFRLLQAASFDLVLGRELIWQPSLTAQRIFKTTPPSSLLELSQAFHHISPRLSAAPLKALIPGAQAKWRAESYDEASQTRLYDIIIERRMDNAKGEACFAGFIRDVTQDYQDVILEKARRTAQKEMGCVSPEDFKAQITLLTQLAPEHCPQAAILTVQLCRLDRLYAHYGIVTVDHIGREVLRRLIAFLPQSLAMMQQDDGVKCLLADASQIDVNSLSKAVTSFPVTTPQGIVSIDLDVSLNLLNAPQAQQIVLPLADKKKDALPNITEDDIIALLNQRSLSLALQPICEASNGELHHYEALLRIDDPFKGPQSAWRHIIAAEEYGLIHLLDHRALERAALLMIRYPHIHIALNISAGTVGDIEKQDDYLRQLDAFPALHERLTVEMTETMALEQPELVAQFAERLQMRGCRLSIDDFGAGHTSFNLLMSTEARQIKLDGSLIDGICCSVSQQNFVRLMVDFAATFNVVLVAERVETAEERLLLASLGVDYLQGYYLGRPISEHDFSGQAPKTAFI